MGTLIFRIIIISLTLFTIPVFAQEMGFYSNEIYDFSFNAPTDWKYRENVGQVKVMIYPYEFDPFDIDSPNIIVAIDNIAESDVPLLNGKELEKYHTDRIREFPGGKLINSDVKDAHWGWTVSTEFVYLGDSGSGVSTQILTEQRAFHFKDREFYTVAYFATEDHYDEYHPVFETVIENMMIKGVVVPEFDEIALMVLGGSILFVILIARKFDLKKEKKVS